MDKLSPSQQKVLSLEEDTVVLAGAGAGKTATLLQALARDLESIPPGEIAVCTFTRSAADSLRARLEETLFEKKMEINLDPIWIGTIDAIAARVIRTRSLLAGQNPDIRAGADYELREMAEEALLRCDAELEPLADWIDVESGELVEILMAISEKPWVPEPPDVDAARALSLMQELLQQASSPKQQEALQSDISKISSGELPGKSKWNIRKQSLQDLLGSAIDARERYRFALLDQKTYPIREALLLLWQEWNRHLEEICQEKGVFSFDVILARARSLQEAPFLRKLYLDEAQDTTDSQYSFLRSLLDGPFISVGDPNQSIYGFRGADLQNFLSETAGQPEVRLEDNYRSAPEILEAVEEICRPLLGDSLLEMRSGGEAARAQGEVVSYVAEDEREALVRILQEELQSREPEEISVLFRSNADLESFYRRARAAGLPVVALRSGGLLLQEECRDLLALAHLLLDPDDQESLLRVLSSPLGGLQIDDLLDISGDLGSANLDLQRFSGMLGKTPLSEVLEYAIESLHFDAALFLLDPGGARWSNVQQFLGLLRTCEEEGWGMEYDLLLEDFKKRLGEERVQTEVAGSLVFQTVHTAKGKEYQVVVLPRMNRRLPHTSRRKWFIDREGQLGLALPGGLRDSVAKVCEDQAVAAMKEEEKRLLYVAMTRARQKLVLLASNKPLRGLVQELPGIKELPPAIKTKKQNPDMQEDPPAESFPVLPPARPERLSWSTLESWSRCSLRRQLEGEWGLRGSQSEGGSGARQRGVRVHDALAGKRVHLLPDEEELVRRARPEWDRGSNPQTEVPFLLPLGPYILRGRIDLVLETEGGHLILDWKTGQKDFDYSLQRKLYALAVPGAVRSETVYLLSGERETDSWSEQEKGSLGKEVLLQIEDILGQQPEPATESGEPFCAGCPGREFVCPVSIALREEGPRTPESESSAEVLEREAE